eukprot:154016_1
MFIYAWISGTLWHCIGWFVFKNGVSEDSVVRDVAILAQNGQWNDMSELMEFGIQIAQKNVNVVVENTVGHCEQIDMTRLILDKCVERYDRFGTSDDPLHYALRNNQPMIVEYLFEKGSKITEKNSEEILRVAVQSYKGNNIMEILDKCLKVNPDAIHEKNYVEDEAIHLALSENRDIKIVQCLLEHGANINAVGSGNRTSIMYANKDINKET